MAVRQVLLQELILCRYSNNANIPPVVIICNKIPISRSCLIVDKKLTGVVLIGRVPSVRGHRIKRDIYRTQYGVHQQIVGKMVATIQCTATRLLIVLAATV